MRLDEIADLGPVVAAEACGYEVVVRGVAISLTLCLPFTADFGESREVVTSQASPFRESDASVGRLANLLVGKHVVVRVTETALFVCNFGVENEFFHLRRERDGGLIAVIISGGDGYDEIA